MRHYANAIRIQLSCLLAIAICTATTSAISASPADYDLSIYGGLGWDPDNNSEYSNEMDSNFWSHYYYDFGQGPATHTGIDYKVDDAENSSEVRSYGYGKVEASVSDCGRVSIRNLVTTGAYFYINLLHGKVQNGELIDESRYVVKNQYIGREDSICTEMPHLHFDVSDQAMAGSVLTANAHPNRLANPSLGAPIVPEKSGLTPHYDTSNTNHVWYHPLRFAEEQQELMLSVHRSEPNPSLTDFDVFGIENRTLHGYLNVDSTTATEAGILIRRSAQRIDADNPRPPEPDWLAHSGGDLGSGLYGYHKTLEIGDDYLLVPYVFSTEDRTGFPIVFSVVKSTDVIADNDKPHPTGPAPPGGWRIAGYSGPEPEEPIPGYFRTADLRRGQSGTTAKWYPGESGRFIVSVYIPENGPTATKVSYRIFSSSDVDPIITNQISHQTKRGQWVPLKSGVDLQDFTFQSGGYVELALGSSVIQNPAGYNTNISADETVAVDAVKFERPCYFRDLSPGTQQRTAIESLCQKGIFSGHPDGTFKPYLSISRAEFSAAMVRAIERIVHQDLDCDLTPIFTDVTDGDCNNSNVGDWWFSYVQKLAGHGVINGYDDGTFRPANSLTAGEIAKFITKGIWGMQGDSMVVSETLLNKTLALFGVGEEKHWYDNYLQCIVDEEVIPAHLSGDLPLTRGEVALALDVAIAIREADNWKSRETNLCISN